MFRNNKPLLRPTVALLYLLFFVIGFSACLNKIPEFNFDQLKHTKVSGLSLAGDRVRGMLVYLPPGYDSTKTKTYPAIIFFHGVAANGNGSDSDLNNILLDSYRPEGYTLPGAIEKGTVDPVVDYKGKTYEYIVITPQTTVYDYPENYLGANSVDSILDYATAHFRIDTQRIYLTGMSTGANMAIEYAGSSVKRAERIAAIATASLCARVNTPTNIADSITPLNIAKAKLPIWFMHCMLDSGKRRSCPPEIAQGWVDQIISAGGLPPRLTILDGGISRYNKFRGEKPAKPCHCNQARHNTWSTMYRQGYNDDGPDLYNWFIQYHR